jgi:hypothetical protein
LTSADHPDYSIAATGELTVVALIGPDSLEMPAQERAGYVHWHGKGVPGQDEWTFRMDQRGNTEDRDNRISCYGCQGGRHPARHRVPLPGRADPGAVAAGRGGLGHDPGA